MLPSWIISPTSNSPKPGPGEKSISIQPSQTSTRVCSPFIKAYGSSPNPTPDKSGNVPLVPGMSLNQIPKLGVSPAAMSETILSDTFLGIRTIQRLSS